MKFDSRMRTHTEFSCLFMKLLSQTIECNVVLSHITFNPLDRVTFSLGFICEDQAHSDSWFCIYMFVFLYFLGLLFNVAAFLSRFCSVLTIKASHLIKILFISCFRVYNNTKVLMRSAQLDIYFPFSVLIISNFLVHHAQHHFLTWSRIFRTLSDKSNLTWWIIFLLILSVTAENKNPVFVRTSFIIMFTVKVFAIVLFLFESFMMVFGFFL